MKETGGWLVKADIQQRENVNVQRRPESNYAALNASTDNRSQILFSPFQRGCTDFIAIIVGCRSEHVFFLTYRIKAMTPMNLANRIQSGMKTLSIPHQKNFFFIDLNWVIG